LLKALSVALDKVREARAQRFLNCLFVFRISLSVKCIGCVLFALGLNNLLIWTVLAGLRAGTVEEIWHSRPSE